MANNPRTVQDPTDNRLSIPSSRSCPFVHHALPTLNDRIYHRINFAQEEQSQHTHIVLPLLHHIILGDPHAPHRLHVRQRRVPHDLPVHVADCRPLTHQHAVTEHGRAADGSGAEGVDIPHGVHRHQAEQLARAREDLDDACAAETVEDEVAEVVDAAGKAERLAWIDQRDYGLWGFGFGRTAMDGETVRQGGDTF